jgi:NADH dehydrogenase
MKNQICTILGGGGFIGRYLVRNLTKKNYRCIISTRKAFQKGYLKTQATPGAIELIDWNPNNFSELKEAIKNSDIVINLIGILYETRKQKFYNIHTDIPEAVSKICSESDVKKFIHVSAIGANENSKSLIKNQNFKVKLKH